MQFSKADLLQEVRFKTSRSGGKGGQNVNKVSSKVELDLDITASKLLSENEKAIIYEKLKNRINNMGILQVICEEERSQLMNKERALERMYILLSKALYQQKPRKDTKPKRSAVEQRLKNKRAHALKKIGRRINTD